MKDPMNSSSLAPMPNAPLVRSDNCSRCKFSTSVPGEPNLQCRRNPPTAAIIQTQRGPMPISSFALTKPEDWCGEWIPKFSVAN